MENIAIEIRTVGDLRRSMEADALSPERLASRVKLSNMTIRRLLKRPDEETIPEKYFLAFNHDAASSAPSTENFEELLEKLERDGKECGDADRLAEEARDKSREANIAGALADQVRKVTDAVASRATSAQGRAIGIGALVYFMNPFDLIPDALPVVGYVDDFAILTLTLAFLAGQMKRSCPPATA